MDSNFASNSKDSPLDENSYCLSGETANNTDNSNKRKACAETDDEDEDMESQHSSSDDQFSFRNRTNWPFTVPPCLDRIKYPTLPKLQTNRLIGRLSRVSVINQRHMTREIISRLKVSAELEGHHGCVNCVEFNDAGSLLVSGSDDCQLLLWDVHRQKKLHAFKTTHTNNIFTAKFVPASGNGLIVSGAGDMRIEVRDISSGQLLHSCSCHTNRVKRIATSVHLPQLFFSAAEDGTVLQYDLRAPHQCDSSPYNVLVDLRPLNNSLYASPEVKCAAISPRLPYEIAVGANDPFVRVYDCRMIKLSRLQSDASSEQTADRFNEILPKNCCRFYVPGHLPSSFRDLQRRLRSLATTYLSYSQDGRYLLANLGGENVYLYDMIEKIPPVKYSHLPPNIVSGSRTELRSELSDKIWVNGSNGSSNGYSHHQYGNTVSCNGNGSTSLPLFTAAGPQTNPIFPALSSSSSGGLPLCPRAETLKQLANKLFGERKAMAAVELYSEALQLAPTSAVLYCNRAAALMMRRWEGDTYAALRDCFRSLSYDPSSPKTYYRLAKCLTKLNRHEEARYCMEDLKTLPVDFSLQCQKLYNDIIKSSLQKFDRDTCGESWREDSSDSSLRESRPSGERGSSGSYTEHSYTRNTSFFSANPAANNPRNNFNNCSAPRPMSYLDQEIVLRSHAWDYLAHYAGHCNTTTDIKEAIFLGPAGNYVAAGSDDGNLFIWEAATGNLVRLLPADDTIVNCVQCHPTTSLLATSGISNTVKLWEPMAQDPKLLDEAEMEQATCLNQCRMNTDPLELLLMHMGDLAHIFNNPHFPVAVEPTIQLQDQNDEEDGESSRVPDFLHRSSSQNNDDNDDDNDDSDKYNVDYFLKSPGSGRR